MQVYTNSKRQSVKTIFAFLLILFVAYLPVSTFLFFIKNDAFNGYFPPKFFMSESIHAGYLPLWNPYINYGIPQYGDMSSGYWSPITWLIAGTTGYNAYTFTIEVLAYILIGGIAMLIIFSFIVALAGKNRTIGYWGAFAISVLSAPRINRPLQNIYHPLSSEGFDVATPANIFTLTIFSPFPSLFFHY